MKNYKKYIFDIDYTILIPDWSKEDDYFKLYIPLEEQERFFKCKQDILNKYERDFPKYNTKTLSDYFGKYGFTVTEDVINGWMLYNGETIVDEVVDGTLALFEYLKENDKEIVILTNWFMKPGLKSFELAIGETEKEDCIMIGDSIRSDKAGADNVGIDCYIVDKNHTIQDLYEVIRSNENEVKKQL